MTFLRSLGAVMLRELRRVRGDSNIVLVLFVAPLAYAALYGSIYIHKIETKVPVAVVDEDRSALSRDLVRRVNAHQTIAVTTEVRGETDIPAALASGDVQAVLVIPRDFARVVMRGEQAHVTLVISPGRLMVLSDVGVAISETVAQFGGTVTARHLADAGVPVSGNSALAQPLAIDYRAAVNPYLTYGDFILPALLAIILIQLALLAAGALSAAENTQRTWHRLSAAANGNALTAAIGKLAVVTLILGVFSCAVRFTLVPLFHVRMEASVWSFILLSLCGCAAAAAMGMFIGTFFTHKVTVFTALGFTSYPFFMVSGYAWPASQLPAAVRWLAQLFPTTPYLQSILSLTQTGLPLAAQWPRLAHLALLTVLYLALFTWRARARMRAVPPAVNASAILAVPHHSH